MIFIDLKKAFDTVYHKIILDKMHRYGIDGFENQWYSSYLHNRRQCCKVSGVTSDTAEINIGVPQGSCLELCSLTFGWYILNSKFDRYKLKTPLIKVVGIELKDRVDLIVKNHKHYISMCFWIKHK